MSFTLELYYRTAIVLLLTTHKIRTLFKILGSKKVTTWRLKKHLRVTINYYEKPYLPVIT